jgi:ABC-type lipoprotein release transport system permease subunit
VHPCGVTQVQDTGAVTNVNAFRSPLIPATDTSAAAGLLPALRAARMSPTQALWAL